MLLYYCKWRLWCFHGNGESILAEKHSHHVRKERELATLKQPQGKHERTGFHVFSIFTMYSVPALVQNTNQVSPVSLQFVHPIRLFIMNNSFS